MYLSLLTHQRGVLLSDVTGGGNGYFVVVQAAEKSAAVGRIVGRPQSESGCRGYDLDCGAALHRTTDCAHLSTDADDRGPFVPGTQTVYPWLHPRARTA